MTDTPERQGSYEQAARLAEADAALLDRLSPDQRETQRAARAELYEYVTMLAEDLKRRDDPAYEDAADLASALGELEGVAETALHTAGDLDEAGEFRHDPDEAEWREHARIEARDEWLSRASLEDLLAAHDRFAPDDLTALEDMIVYRRANPH